MGAACGACRRRCGDFWSVVCAERVLSPLLVLTVHGLLVSDVLWHRADLREATDSWWPTCLWLLVASTLTCYLRACLTDPGWLRPPGAPGPPPGSCWATSLLCCCATVALAMDWQERLERRSSGAEELKGLTELSPTAQRIGRAEGDPEPATLCEEGLSAGPGDLQGIQKRRGSAEDAPAATSPGQPSPRSEGGGGGGGGAAAEPCSKSGDDLQMRWCKRCLLYQPLRSKHCPDCQRCVRTHDHHCPWIGSCVGENNRVIFYWFLVLQCLELVVFFREGVQGISLLEPSVVLVVGLLFIAMFFIMVTCLLVFHTFLVLSNLTTWEHVSWRRITYLKHLPEDRGSPFARSMLSNVGAYCCGPRWCPPPLRRLGALRYDDDGGAIWELSEPRAPCCLVRMCGECCM